MSGVKVKIQNLIDAGNEVTGYDDDNLTDVVQALIDGFGGGGSSRLYTKYMSHISPMDGYYNSHSYDAVFIKNGFLYAFYTQAPSHFTDKTDSTTSLMLCKYNLSTKTVVSNTVIMSPARCFWHGIEVSGTYYLFAESGTKYRLSTTDFINFTETTWTAPLGYSNMNYIIEGANHRLICTTGQTTKGMKIYYSDDLGLTWTLASGYSDAITTHGGFVHLGNGKIVLYCQDSYSGNTSASVTEKAHATKRVVMISDDNGETWTGSLCQNSDLVDCGITYSTGSFCKIDDDWYFGTSRRLIELQTSGTYKLGDIRLFKGTEQDVINGTMSLYKVVDNFDTGATAISVSLIDIQSDSGNMCMRSDGSSLYLVYHKPLLHQDSNDYCESTSMLCLATAEPTKGQSLTDDFYNPNWETERDSFVSAKNTSYSLYAYGETTNIGNGIYSSSDYEKIESTDIVPINELSIPFTNSFEIIAVVEMYNRYINGEFAHQYVGANISGNTYIFGGTINAYRLNRPNDSAAGTCSLGTKGGRYQYFRLKLANGVISSTLNGRTIPDFKCPALVETGNIPNKTIGISLGDMESFMPSYTASGKVEGFKALAINTDGDVSDFYKYSVTYNGNHCTFSNNATLVSGSYTCKVTPDEGYELRELTYTMGGTSHTVSGDTVTIQNVTGKLVINATIAEEETELTTDGLVAWYDIGDSSKIDSSGVVTSNVANSFVAWTGLANLGHTINNAVVPAVFYSGYANTRGAIQIWFDQPISNISSTISLEYIIADNYSSFSFMLNAGIKAATTSSVGNTWSFGYNGGTGTANNRTFSQVVLVIDSTGITKVYINKELKFTNVSKSNCMTVNTFGIGTTSTTNTTVYLGHCRVYNKELTSAEIENNYKYFAANCKVGQTAYDSSGNFVG